MHHSIKRVLSCVIAVAMLLAVVPFSSSAINAAKQTDKMSFAAMSDIHYFPAELTGNYCEEFVKDTDGILAREPLESVGILDSALAGVAAHAKENGTKYLVIPGDLTSNSEYLAHVKLAERLEQFEQETGIQVIVAPGNHDNRRYDNAQTYENGYKEQGRATQPQEFLEIYKNLGYDIAYHTYTPSSGEANMLSYSVRTEDGYRFLVQDLCKYTSELTSSGEDEAETSGAFSDEYLDWVLDELADAKACGDTVISVNHHNLIPHYESEYTIIRGFVVDGWEEITDKLVDAGLHFSLTGHIHTSDIAETVTDNGETLTEVCVDSLTAFPNYFREFEMYKNGDGDTVMEVESCDVDCVKPVTVNGVTYEQPYRKTASLARTFFDGETGLIGLADRVLRPYVEEFSENGVSDALVGMGLDLEELFEDLLGGGLVIGGVEIFTAKNIMSFLNDLLSQMDEKFLSDPDKTMDYLLGEIDKLLSVQVSEVPNSRFYEEYGIGHLTGPSDLDDLIQCLLIYMYEGSYLMEDDPFMTDALYNLENGDTIFKLFDALLEIAADDLLNGKILADLEFRPGTLIPSDSPLASCGTVLDVIIKLAFLGDPSYLNITNDICKLLEVIGLVEFDSLWGIVENYMDNYLTDTQLEGVGQTLADIVRGFAQDPSYHEDNFTKIVYSGKVDVEATRDNYRLPTAVSVTFGADQGSRNVSWYTKPSVTGTDIEIVRAGESFKGVSSAPAGVSVNKTTEKTTRQFPGIDLGVMGIMNYKFPMNRHIVEVSGLRVGQTYYYRVGDASRGWWSETGSFTAADGSDKTTFIHVSDPQSQSAQQYATFSKVIETAYEMYDEAGFIVNTGDCVDHGDNFKQWKWFLDGASETLMNTVMMPASGNHEEKGSNATVTNFTFSNVPEQDTETGIYYSFDYNNVHVAVLNTNDLNDDEMISDEQLEWFIDDMQSSDADWKIVTFHKAIYSNGSHYKDDDVCAMRDCFSELMPQLGIDIVFQGHDHVYLRTDAMIDNEVETVATETVNYNGKDYTAKVDPVGTVYTISGCSGVKVYKQKDASLTDEYFPRAERIVDVDDSVFTGVVIDGDTLYFDAYSVDVESGETENIDSFAIKKDITVQKGTGVPEPSVCEQILTQLVEAVLPVLKMIINQIADFLKAQLF